MSSRSANLDAQRSSLSQDPSLEYLSDEQPSDEQPSDEQPSDKQIERTPLTLTNCDREPIRIPGQIQPHGILIVLEPATLKILQISANVDAWLNQSPADLLGHPLSQLLGDAQAQAVSASLSPLLAARPEKGEASPVRIGESINDKSPVRLRLPYAGIGGESEPTQWSGVLHVDEETVILEITPRQSAEKDPAVLYDMLHRGLSQFQQADDFKAIANIVVQTVQALTGMDRVMVYQLEADYGGAVIAEAIREHRSVESFLDLRFPATDIPVQAQQLYLQNWLRMIPDVGYRPVPIVPERHSLQQRSLDLGAASLRSVSPMHIEYLQNMGVSASMSISLITEDRLWGLIACHHYEPKHIDYETRKACEFLGQMASVELFRQQTLIEKEYQAQVRAIQQQIRQTIAQLSPAHAIESVLIQYQQELLTLVQATGAVIALGSQMTLIGKTPPANRIRPMLDWLIEQNQDVYDTQALSQVFEPAQSDKETASGLLAISIFLPQASYHILWFRPEQKQAVTWAGNPNKPTTITEGGSEYLTPRQSFERWQETVYEQSLPWQPTEIAAAQELRATLLLTALEFSRSALRETAQKAQVANQAKSQFLAKMSHELRTPLNAILGFTQLIHYQETLSVEQRDRLDIINRSGEHLLALINDVLETSRIEAGQPRLSESYFDLYQLIASVRDMLTLRAVRKGLLLKLAQSDQLPQYAYGDESKLRQIIINLVGNAVKFTAQGEVTLSVSPVDQSLAVEPSVVDIAEPPAQLLAPGRVRVQFEVKDTGPGIYPENLKSIFEPFHQTERGREASEGTGLGLSICRQNARLMGGDIEVQSQLSQGSTFTCYVNLSLATADDVRPNLQQRRVVSLAPNQPQYRILVAEDVAENRQLLISLLAIVGFEVRSVENGAQAVELWHEWNPHCIWMDLYMPEMDGYEATRQIRAAQSAAAASATSLTYPETVNKPIIIALSASVIDHTRDEMIEIGFDDYVSKPFQVNKIFEKMGQHLGIKYQYANDSAASEQAKLQLADAVADISNWPAAAIEALQAQLKKQPQAWQTDFYQAVLGARERKIKALIEQLPHRLTNQQTNANQPDNQQVNQPDNGCNELPDLAHVLNRCVDQLQFDILIRLVQPLAQLPTESVTP